MFENLIIPEDFQYNVYIKEDVGSRSKILNFLTKNKIMENEHMSTINSDLVIKFGFDLDCIRRNVEEYIHIGLDMVRKLSDYEDISELITEANTYANNLNNLKEKTYTLAKAIDVTNEASMSLSELNDIIKDMNNISENNDIFAGNDIDTVIDLCIVAIEQLKKSINRYIQIIQDNSNSPITESTEIDYFSEASMEDSFIYKTFNNSNDILSKILKVLKTAIIVDKTLIEDQYYQIKRAYISPLSQNVIEAFDNGDIEIVYNKNEKIPISIPFIIRRKGNSIVATIFISSFTGLTENKDRLNIPMKNLYCIMESAYIARCIQLQPDRMRRNTQLQRITCDIYVQIMMRILNRDFALTLDQELYNSVSFCISKFYLERIWEINNKSVVYNYAVINMKNPNHSVLETIEMEYDDADIKDVSELLEFIKNISPRLNGLSVKFFIERYINSYNPPALLSMDYLPYLFFVIISIRLGSFLVSQNSLSDIIKNAKGINNFHNELAKMY